MYYDYAMAAPYMAGIKEKENLVKDENYEKQDFVVPFLSSKELVDMGLVKPIAKPQFLFGKGFPMTTDVNDDTKTMDFVWQMMDINGLNFTIIVKSLDLKLEIALLFVTIICII